MQNSFGYLFLFIFWVCGFIVIKLRNRKEVNTKVSFLLSNRNVGFFMGAITTAAAWIWAPALFVASQKAFEQGIPGLFWFSFPNVMALVLFSFLASRMKKIFNYGYTLPEYMKNRFDKKMQIIYMVTIFVIQIYSVILQITAALLLLNFITGINKTVLIVILSIMIISLSLFRGFRSSLAIDTIKAALIAIVGFIIVPWTIDQSGGLSNIIHGMGGVSGNFSNIFNMKVALAFGIPISVSLLSGIVVDQQQWQRAFAMKNNTVRKSFLLGAVFFSFIPLLLGVLGFAAAGSNIAIDAGQTQLAGVLLVKNYLPQVGVYIFSFMILAGLVAAGISALSAASSVGVIDLLHLFKKDVSDKKTILISRITMIIILLIAVSIALIPNIQLVYLMLLVGVFRAALMIPTILSLYWSKLSTNFTFSGIVFGMLIGMPLFIYGSVTKNLFISSFGSLMPIIVSTTFCVLGAIFKPANFDYEKLK